MNKRIIILLLTAPVLLALSCSKSPEYASRADRLIAELKNPKSDYVMVMAHRADWRNWPENSLEAIESAINMGCDILELDVAMTRDSQLVLSHDNTLDRMTNGHGKIIDHTLAQIKELTPEVEKFAKDIVDSGSRVWVGTMWKSADGGLDDDRAALSGDPDSIYGKLVDMGCSVIMTDRPAQVIQSLHRLGRHPALGVQ